jgi:hypothetical protein
MGGMGAGMGGDFTEEAPRSGKDDDVIDADFTEA